MSDFDEVLADGVRYLPVDLSAQTLSLYSAMTSEGLQMIFVSRARVRLTTPELNQLRQAAARNGHVVNRIDSPADLLQATLDGLAPERQSDLLEFLETGSSPLTREASVRPARS